MNRIIKLTAVKEKTGISRSSIYLLVSKNKFPSPIKIGKRAVGWIEEEIDLWIDQQIRKSRQKGGVNYDN